MTARAVPPLAWLGLAIALLVGGFARLWHLDAASLYTDEAFTYTLAGLPLPALFYNLTFHDFHPPLFYLAGHFLETRLHWPPWQYRYFVAPFGLLTILAAWGAARRMFGDIAAIIAALVVALSPTLVQYDRIYRMYAVLVALATLSWWLLIEAQAAVGRRRRAWLWVGYGLTVVALPYVHYLGILVLACEAAFMATRARSSTPGFAALGVATLAFVPWLPSLAHQLPLGGVTLSTPGLDAGLAASIRGAFERGFPDAFFSWPGAGYAAALLLLAVFVAAIVLAPRTALPYWLGCFVLAVGLSIALRKNLAYFPHYLLVDVPPVAVALGLIVRTIGQTWSGPVAATIGAAVVALYGMATANMVTNPYYQFPDWYALNAVMLAHEHTGDAVVLDAGYEQFIVRDYTAFRGRTMLSFMNPGDFQPILSWIAQHPDQRVWYVQHQNFYWDPKLRIATALHQTREQLLSERWPRQSPVDDVSVTLYDRATAGHAR